jgi:hypothetical protein
MVIAGGPDSAASIAALQNETEIEELGPRRMS